MYCKSCYHQQVTFASTRTRQLTFNISFSFITPFFSTQLQQFLEATLGFPNTIETLQVVQHSCTILNLPLGLSSPSQFCPLFLPQFRNTLTEIRTTRKLPITTSIATAPHTTSTTTTTTTTTTTEGETKQTTSIPEQNQEQTSSTSTTQQLQQLQLDEYGCIPNPIPKQQNQLLFGGVLQLERVKLNAWQTNPSLNNAWSSVDPSLFNLRGKKYLYNKKKYPSNFSIYDAIHVDILSTEKRWFCSSNAFWTPNVPPEEDINGMPTRLTIEITFPTFDAENAVWGTQKQDGPSHVWLITCVLCEEARKQLLGQEPLSEGVAYAREFMQRDDPHHGCFKTICTLANPNDSKVSAALGFTGRTLVKNYNGKPYLSNNSHRIRRSPGHVTICQDVHTFGYMVRSNYATQVKHLQDAVVNLGWTIEGRNEDHLPEQLLAGIGMIKINPTPKNDKENIDQILLRNEIESGVECFRVKPAEWIQRSLHLKKSR